MRTTARVSRRKARQGGNALLEFSICAVLMLMLTCGVTDFARLFTVANMATDAAQAGTQYGGLSPAHWGDISGMQKYALLDIDSNLSDMNYSTSSDTCSGTNGACTLTAGTYKGATATATQVCYCATGGSPVTCPASCGSAAPQTYVQVTVSAPFTSLFSYPLLPNLSSLTFVSTARVQ